MEKLNFFGVGPKIGMITLPYLAVTITLSIIYKQVFLFSASADKPIMIIGIVILAIGLVFYMVTGRLLMQGLKNTKLMTTGTYYLCQNPLYTSIILLVIPGLALTMNSWLILTTTLVGYIVFKMRIKSEYAEMEKFFGQEYLDYRKKTPEFIPLPFKKWIKA